jgi:hypothetical protein
MFDRIKLEISRSRTLIDHLKVEKDSGAVFERDKVSRYCETLLNRIAFYQHERLIHLLVLILFALLTFGSLTVFLISMNYALGFATILFFALLIPYIVHYYHLENGVQKLYTLYDELAAFLEEKYE